MRFHRLAALYRRNFCDPRRERLFLASLGFFLTFGLTRFVTHAFREHPVLGGVVMHGTHVHHLVWGILLLLVAGYLGLALPRDARGEVRLARLITLLYAVGAALTLDEFALWLQLRDVYWEREGRASIDAVMLFGALVSAGLWAGPFVRAIVRHVIGPWWRICVVRPWRAVRPRAAIETAPVPALEPVPALDPETARTL